MQIDTLVNSEFKSNTYIVSAPGSNSVIVIDPAGDNDKLLRYLDQNNYAPQYVILTHEHFDHITGTNALKKRFPNSNIVCSEACAKGIVDAKLNLSYYRNAPYVSVKADVIITGEETINWHYPVYCFNWEGHSPGGMLCLINDALFCGDQFIKGIKTVTNLPGSKKEKVTECLDFLIGMFPAENIMYPGHGDKMFLHEVKLH